MTADPAVLETSFWTVCHRADLLSYLFDYYDVIAPPAVHDDLLAPDPRFPLRRYGYAELFRLLQGRGLLRVATPERVIGRFGRGEDEAIALAAERGWRLLINDQRPQAFARQQGLMTATVPTFILRLYAHDVISLRAAKRKLSLISEYTSRSVLYPVQQALERMARERREQSS